MHGDYYDDDIYRLRSKINDAEMDRDALERVRAMLDLFSDNPAMVMNPSHVKVGLDSLELITLRNLETLRGNLRRMEQ